MCNTSCVINPLESISYYTKGVGLVTIAWSFEFYSTKKLIQ